MIKTFGVTSEASLCLEGDRVDFYLQSGNLCSELPDATWTLDELVDDFLEGYLVGGRDGYLREDDDKAILEIYQLQIKLEEQLDKLKAVEIREAKQ